MAAADIGGDNNDGEPERDAAAEHAFNCAGCPAVSAQARAAGRRSKGCARHGGGARKGAEIAGPMTRPLETAPRAVFLAFDAARSV